MTKRFKKTGLIVILTGFMLMSSQSLLAASVSRAEMLAHQCFTCHGTNGIGSLKIPELNSLKKSDILESLNGFKTGEEKSTIMDRHAKAYTDAEIKLLAEYFVSLKK